MGQYVIKIVDKWGNTSFVECENDDEAGRVIEKWMHHIDDLDAKVQIFEVIRGRCDRHEV